VNDLLTGRLVSLRRIREEDYPQFLEWYSDPEILRYSERGPAVPLTQKGLEKMLGSGVSGEEVWFAVETRDGTLIGDIGLNPIDQKNRLAQLVITIGDKNRWGQGYGTDAAMVILRIGFNELNLHRVELSTFAFNERAIRLYQRCGFRREGVRRECLFRNGQYHDEIHLGLLADEFIPLAKQYFGQ